MLDHFCRLHFGFHYCGGLLFLVTQFSIIHGIPSVNSDRWDANSRNPPIAASKCKSWLKFYCSSILITFSVSVTAYFVIITLYAMIIAYHAIMWNKHIFPYQYVSLFFISFDLYGIAVDIYVYYYAYLKLK